MLSTVLKLTCSQILPLETNLIVINKRVGVWILNESFIFARVPTVHATALVAQPNPYNILYGIIQHICLVFWASMSIKNIFVFK